MIPEYLRRNEYLENLWLSYTSAGILVVNSDHGKVLLGTHKEMPSLWGNFAGEKSENDNNPFDTVMREAYEELGISLNIESLGQPLIVHKTWSDKVGIIFPTAISDKTHLEPPKNGEIHSIAWFTSDNVSRLIDEYRHDLRLWGGVYTYEALHSWLQTNHKADFLHQFGGITKYDGNFSWGLSPYGRLKNPKGK